MDTIFHPKYLEHRQHGTHPESPDRLRSILSRLEGEKLIEDVLIPESAEREILEKTHAPRYLDMLERGSGQYIDGGDTYLGEETYEIARLAVGGALKGVERAVDGDRTIALLRPPGHHAGKDYGGGFCYLNNAAIAADHLNSGRVAIIDLDAHHGNGTSDIFYSDPNVLYISTHHHGIYPGTGDSMAIGEGPGIGYNVNVPFKTGCGDSSMDFAWSDVIKPIVTQYEPELIIVSIGTDGHYADKLTGLTYSSQCYIRMAERITALSKELCGGSVSYMLEGGYHLDCLSEITAGIVASELGKEVSLEYTRVSDTQQKGKEEVLETKDALKKYWELT
ncbi:MAG: histone deacetylase family protein [Candidatus Saliniplasma sp.]